MSEVDLIQPHFIERVFDVVQLPIDHKAYEESQINIQRFIWRLQGRRKRVKSLDERVKMNSMISKLRAIEKDLQKALERWDADLNIIKKAVSSDFKAKIDSKTSMMTMLSNHITTGFEMKNVEREVEFDFDKGLKRFYYQGVLYDTQSMTDEDRQLEIGQWQNF